MKKSLYYAHHMFKYDTRMEEYELQVIRKNFPEYDIINPNGDIPFEKNESEQSIMGKCLEVIERENVDCLVFSSMNGVVGQGVFAEVNHALALGKKIYYIHNNGVEKCRAVLFDIINENGRIYASVKRIG